MSVSSTVSIASKNEESSKSREEFFLVNNRWALKLFSAKNPMMVVLFSLPILGYFFFNIIKFEMDILTLIFAGFSGVFYWLIVEYLVHRYYFHWTPKNKTLKAMVQSFHIYHHKHPNDLEVINTGWFTTYIGIVFHYTIWIFLLGDSLFLHAYLFSFVISFCFYEYVHYTIHQKHYNSGIISYFQEFHLTHHMKPNKNYGVVSPVGDILFNTKIKNEKVKSHKRMAIFVKELRESDGV